MSSKSIAAVLFCLVAACGSTQSSITNGDSEWLEPSPALRQQIEGEAKRLPWTHGMERVELIHWFARVGEPAYPTLLGMVLDPRKDVACSALAASAPPATPASSNRSTNSPGPKATRISISPSNAPAPSCASATGRWPRT